MNGPNRNRLLIGGVTGAAIILIVVLAFALGRQSAPPATKPGSVNKIVDALVGPAPPANQTTPTPASAGDPDDALSRWLAGG